jgi:hypothetical protein
MYLDPVLQLQHGSGSVTLYICTLYVDGKAPAMNIFTTSMQFLLYFRGRSRIKVKLRLLQNWFFVAPAPQQ